MKPCPICGIVNFCVEENGIECLNCGLWFGAGSKALTLWRKIRGAPYLSPATGWLEEVWNSRVIAEKEQFADPLQRAMAKAEKKLVSIVEKG